MKRSVISLIVVLTFISSGSVLSGQNSPGKSTIIYSVFFNIVPDGFNIPLIGFVNVANGSHESAHLGFFNMNQADFTGAQLGFVNITGGKVKGLQAGFINTCGNRLNGLQLSFVNTCGDHVDGGQAGFVNICADTLSGIQAGFININGGFVKGPQLGFVNIAGGEVKGPQLGFVNIGGGPVKGPQLGFVNIAGGGIKGPQIGFVNAAKSFEGIQLGFVNVADQIEKGIPIGFLSFVKRGGYRALEVSVTEMHPVSLSFKTGVKALYTSVIASYNPDLETDFAIGMGLGTHIPFSKSVYFNPEVTAQNEIRDNYRQTVSLATNLAFCLNQRIQLAIGPSVVWNHADKAGDLIDPLFSLYTYEIDHKNNILVGLRAALRINLTEW